MAQPLSNDLRLRLVEFVEMTKALRAYGKTVLHENGLRFSFYDVTRKRNIEKESREVSLIPCVAPRDSKGQALY